MAMNRKTAITRRLLIKASLSTTGGLLLGFPLTGHSQPLSSSPIQSQLNAFIEIGSDDSVIFTIHKPENGQGSVTALSMLLAEELDFPIEEIRWRFAPVQEVYGYPGQGTYNSNGIADCWTALREAGAAAREMLVQAAAHYWRVDVTDCRAESGYIIRKDGESIRYGKVADIAAAIPVPKHLKLKTSEDFQYIGSKIKRLDTPDKVCGQAVYASDVRLPSMAYAVLAYPDRLGGEINNYDDSHTLKVAGVIGVYPVSGGIAVVAENSWAAIQGRKKLKINWKQPGSALSSGAIADLQETALETSGQLALDEGDVDDQINFAPTVLFADYTVPFQSHSTIETQSTLASVDANRCEIWSGTQIPGLAHLDAIQASYFPPEKVSVNSCLIGGAFGSRGKTDIHSQAIEISMACGRPVSLFHTRKDDVRNGRFSPASKVRLNVALDKEGRPTVIKGHVVNQPTGEIIDGVDQMALSGMVDMPYQFRGKRVEYSALHLPVPVGRWRSSGYFHNVFALESFMDEIASSINKDPYILRRQLLDQDRRLVRTMDAVSVRAGWGKPLPDGHFQGLAIARCFDTCIAGIAQISKSDGGIVIQKLTCVVDCGHVINPGTVKQQIQGGIVFGLSAVIKTGIFLNQGRVEQSGVADYGMLRIDEIVITENSSDKPSGVGSVATPIVAPAITNAIYAATGKRIRELPIKLDSLS